MNSASDAARRLAAALATYWSRAQRIDRRCYLLAAALLASGLAHLAVQAVAGGPWSGPVSWRKPVTFGVAFALTLATLTWVTTFVPVGVRTRARLLGAFAVASAVEVTVITAQAWRGVPSHFNVSTPLNAIFAYAAAAGGGVLIATSVAFASHAVRTDRTVPRSMRFAVRAGFVSFLGALGLGATMIAIGVYTTRTVSQAAAYTAATGLKPGHAALMHGLLVLPALAWAASFTCWDEPRRVRIIALATTGYAIAALAIATGLGPVAIAGTAILLTAALLVVVALLRLPLSNGLEHAAPADT